MQKMSNTCAKELENFRPQYPVNYNYARGMLVLHKPWRVKNSQCTLEIGAIPYLEERRALAVQIGVNG